MRSTKPLHVLMQEGKKVIGSFILGHDPGVVRVAASAGMDFVLLDYEHGTPSDELTARFIDAAEGTNLSLLVRCEMSALPILPRLFDHGLNGALIAGAQSLEDVHRIVETIKFAPTGKRGLNPFVPAAEYGVKSGHSFMAEQNERTQIWILAENRQILVNLEQICTLPGVNGAFLGPYDLSVDLGFPGEVNHPVVVAEIERAIATLGQHHIPAGIYAKDAESAKTWLARGMSFVVVGFDWSLLRNSWASVIETCLG